MRQRNGILVLLVISILISLSGCTFTQIANGPERNSDPMTGTVTPEPKIMANPVPLLCGVETDKRVVSLVFEGYTDDSTMTAIAEVLEEKEIPAVFFLSGITANEHPSTLRKLAGGFEIGNYGMGGGKHLENYSAFENAEKFKLAQEQITQATGKRPTLLRCNNTEYTEDVLRAASAAGLSAAVQPTAYLNHRSFKNADEAYSYALHVLRGSILSIKLGQELDKEEYDDLGERLDERPAIDPKPGIRWEWSSEEEIYASIPELVKWLIEALENFGYEFTDPLSLQRSATELLRKTGELSQEEIKQLGVTPDTTYTDEPRKKILKGYKVNGYRVQVFAGGNSRDARVKAEKTGREINALFPGEPVYVHFYSPRWICRMGNYRTYEEAHQILNAVKKLGYKSAIIVKGKITVPYLPANTVTTTNP